MFVVLAKTQTPEFQRTQETTLSPAFSEAQAQSKPFQRSMQRQGRLIASFRSRRYEDLTSNLPTPKRLVVTDGLWPG